jgi:hypothetical protein
LYDPFSTDKIGYMAMLAFRENSKSLNLLSI